MTLFNLYAENIRCEKFQMTGTKKLLSKGLKYRTCRSLMAHSTTDDDIKYIRQLLKKLRLV